jgi:hypothetical protein
MLQPLTSNSCSAKIRSTPRAANLSINGRAATTLMPLVDIGAMSKRSSLVLDDDTDGVFRPAGARRSCGKI